MKLYVLVEVKYDYHRFQDNIRASVEDNFGAFYPRSEYSFWPILRYHKDDETAQQLDRDEKCHYWVQEFDI